jgi:hypothetical protein
MFVKVAQTLGINGIHHIGLKETKKRLKLFKFENA